MRVPVGFTSSPVVRPAIHGAALRGGQVGSGALNTAGGADIEHVCAVTVRLLGAASGGGFHFQLGAKKLVRYRGLLPLVDYRWHVCDVRLVMPTPESATRPPRSARGFRGSRAGTRGPERTGWRVLRYSGSEVVASGSLIGRRTKRESQWLMARPRERRPKGATSAGGRPGGASRIHRAACGEFTAFDVQRLLLRGPA